MRVHRKIYTLIFNLVFVGSIFNVFFSENTPVFQPFQIELCLSENRETTPTLTYTMPRVLEPSAIPFFGFPGSFSFLTFVEHANSLIAVAFTSAVSVYKPLPGFCFGKLHKTFPSEPSEAIVAIG